MTDTNATIARWFAELRRRKVVRVAIVYIVIAWLLIQVADATFEPIGLPTWANRLVIVLAMLGFPLACGLAWAFDVTPRGIERTPAPDARSRGTPGTTAGPALGAAAWLAPQPAVAAAASLPGAGNPSVAILPFADMSAARDQEYFCDGIAEEIINALCCVRGLQVASRTSSFQFKGRAADVREIGRSLGVTAVLEGSVRRSEERVRITAQLVSSSDGFHLWSESFDRRLEDVFATQSEIARNIVSALRSSLTREEEELIERGGTRNPEAYEYYLRARQLHNEHSDTTIRQAIGLFRRAIEADPEFAKAHAGLAMALGSAIFWRIGVTLRRDGRGDACREAGEELVPDLPEAWLAQGNLYSASLRPAESPTAHLRRRCRRIRIPLTCCTSTHAMPSAPVRPRSRSSCSSAHSESQPEDYQIAALLAGSVRKLGDRASHPEARIGQRLRSSSGGSSSTRTTRAHFTSRLGCTRSSDSGSVQSRSPNVRSRCGRASSPPSTMLPAPMRTSAKRSVRSRSSRASARSARAVSTGSARIRISLSLHGDPRFERVVARLVAIAEHRQDG